MTNAERQAEIDRRKAAAPQVKHPTKAMVWGKLFRMPGTEIPVLADGNTLHSVPASFAALHGV